MFTHYTYFPFLLLTAVIYWLLPRQTIRTAFLTLCSYAFIWYFDHKAIYVVAALTVFTYLMAGWMGKSKYTGFVHKIGVTGLLLVLILCKYLGFLTGTLNSLLSFFHTLPLFSIEKLFLPMGISYLVFKYISYLTDIHWKIVTKGKFIDFACYGSLFPIFVAGPIERFERLKPQLETEAGKFKAEYLSSAFERIVYGLFKKHVLADWLGYLILPVWQTPEQYSTIVRALGLFGYSLQIYFDFAGYSDIAIGSSRLFGLKIMENFNNPYLAPNISQFWRRWHISLSDWIRDYLFFPLSQGKTSRLWLTFFVPVIAMGLCGLWHGSAWRFAIWGVWHGLGISAYQYLQYLRRKKVVKIQIPDSINQITTFMFVTIGWLIFNGGNELLISLLSLNGLAVSMIGLFAYIAIVQLTKLKYNYSKNWILFVVILLGTFVLYCGMDSGFIYDKF